MFVPHAHTHTHADLDRKPVVQADLTSCLQEQTFGLLTIGFIQDGSRRKTTFIKHQEVPNRWRSEGEGGSGGGGG